MKKLNLLFSLIILLFSFQLLTAQCLNNEIEVTFKIAVNQWAYEVSWDLTDENNTSILSGSFPSGTNMGIDSQSICVNSNSCLTLNIYDSFGDGISASGDFYVLTVDGDTLAYELEYDFDYQETYQFNCPQGSTCIDSYIANTDIIYTAPFDATWYTFTPSTTGLYQFTTCNLSNTCDTKIWVFEDCNGNIFTENEEGTLAYNNDDDNCAPLSTLSTAMEAGVTYYIKIGDNNDNCLVPINWEATFLGEISGCTDPNSCNYEPLATIAEPCIYPGDPTCPDGPDLIIDQAYALNSIFLENKYFDPNDNFDVCQVEEGCIRGLGDRTLIRFATRIENIGSLDYYIGNPSANPDQFDYQNCHGHGHYKGYAEYLLFDENFNEIPVGFKAGFCVMDIDCLGGGNAQYNCSTMGISAGCADIYGAGTTCNWIDITDVDTGDYTFVIRTNWDQDPDALGRHELDYSNNWAQICIKIEQDNIGNKSFAINPDCDIYVDCAGDTLGNALIDCEGTCNGTTITGDINNDGVQSLGDAQTYVSDILSTSPTATNCNDLNGDGEINIFDAALIQDCYYGEFDPHTHNADALLDHCNFPYGFTNIGDTVWLKILDYNLEDKYIDIGLKNPYNTVLAYEFTMNGLSITHADNLYDNSIYPISPDVIFGGDKIIGISYQDSIIPKHFDFVPFVRINYFDLIDNQICINDIIAIVGGRYETVVTIVEGPCIEVESNPTITFTPPSTICSNESPISLSATPNGGVFSGSGVTGNSFNPNTAGIGIHQITYTYQGVQSSVNIEVLDASLTISMSDQMDVLLSDPSFELEAIPSGGTFSGTGVDNNYFNPNIAGVGEHIVTYAYPLSNGCTATKNMVISVAPSVGIFDLDNTLDVRIAPNPFNSFTTLSFDNPKRVSYTLEIINTTGQTVRTYQDIRENQIKIEKNNLVNGIYLYKLSGEYKNIGRIIIY